MIMAGCETEEERLERAPQRYSAYKISAVCDGKEYSRLESSQFLMDNGKPSGYCSVTPAFYLSFSIELPLADNRLGLCVYCKIATGNPENMVGKKSAVTLLPDEDNLIEWDYRQADYAGIGLRIDPKASVLKGVVIPIEYEKYSDGYVTMYSAEIANGWLTVKSVTDSEYYSNCKRIVCEFEAEVLFKSIIEPVVERHMQIKNCVIELYNVDSRYDGQELFQMYWYPSYIPFYPIRESAQ